MARRPELNNSSFDPSKEIVKSEKSKTETGKKNIKLFIYVCIQYLCNKYICMWPQCKMRATPGLKFICTTDSL